MVGGNNHCSREWQSLQAGLAAPIITSTAFSVRDAATTSRGEKLIYARQEYPGCYAAERSLSILEKAESTLLFSSGMAAITTFFRSLPAGSRIIMPCELYWPHKLWVQEFAQSYDVELRWSEGLELEDFTKLVDENTSAVWVEFLSNPALRMVNVRALAAALPDDVPLAVNASCLSPALARPLELGANFVIHSASKILGGHNDLMGGSISVREVTPLFDQVARGRWLSGNGLSSRDSACLNRSLETLRSRVEKGSESALALALHMRAHPLVTDVNYIGIPDHPDHEIARQNLLGRGYGQLVGINLNLSPAECQWVCEATQIWTNATSYGSARSTIEHRATSEYMVSQSGRTYLRLSVGLEPVEDLISDLMQALDQFKVSITG